MGKTKPLVVIVGRPNVGKSALFNRIIERRMAIVEDEPGITRDRLYSESTWRGRPFILVDTGGLESGDCDITRQVRLQVELAIEEADVILFVVDARQGLTPQDEEVARILRAANKPLILVVNKVDRRELVNHAMEFYALGLGDPVLVSAEHGRNIGDLLDMVVDKFPAELPEEETEDEDLKVAVVGRPNVGKSSLVNAILGEERVIVTDIPGTTRDAIDTHFMRNDRAYTLIDTAGMRRKGRIDDSVERYSVYRTLRAVERSDVCLFLLDATAGVVEQDQRIAGFVHESGKGIIIVVNKWDLIEATESTMREYEEQIRRQLAFLTYAPVVFVSALTKKRLPQLMDMVDYVADQSSIRVSTGALNRLLQDALARVQPPARRGVRLKAYYMVQTQVQPPTFLLFVNQPELLHFSYRRYLENRLRETYGFHGSPIIIKARARE